MFDLWHGLMTMGYASFHQNASRDHTVMTKVKFWFRQMDVEEFWYQNLNTNATIASPKGKLLRHRHHLLLQMKMLIVVLCLMELLKALLMGSGIGL
jgi:hypothetical protein